jgi:hypothetical protein
MTQDIDLQAQMEGESDRAYLAYTTYRDMGTSRTVYASYALYVDQIAPDNRKKSQKVANPSKTYRDWFTHYAWDDRIKDWDSKKRDRIQSAQLEADRQGYIQRIEDSRLILERTATMGMKAAELSLAVGYDQLQKIAKESRTKILPKAEIDRLLGITRNSKESIETLAAAKTEIYDALGLVETIERLGDAKNQAI